jgi:hypothetical protein
LALSGPRLWVSAAHFGASLLGCEHPFDAGTGSIALALPGGDLGDELLEALAASIEALPANTPISISTMLSQLACLGR